MAELTRDELASMLAKLDDVVREAQELAAQIKARLADERKRDAPTSNWSRGRVSNERRKRQRG